MPAYGFQSCGQYDVCQFGTVGECIGPDILYLCLYGQGCHFGCSVESGVVYFGDGIVTAHERYFFRNRDFTCICRLVGCLDSVGIGFAVYSCMGDSDRGSFLRSVFDHIGHIFARENISRIYGDGLFSEILEIAPSIIRSYGISFLLLPLNVFSTYYFQAMVKPTAAFLISVARGLVLSGILIFLLPIIAGANAIWFAMPITELIIAIFVIALIIRYTKQLPVQKKNS